MSGYPNPAYMEYSKPFSILHIDDKEGGLHMSGYDENRGISKGGISESIARAVRDGILTDSQASFLDQLISATSLFDYGKRKILSNLVLGCAEEPDSQRRYENLQLLRKYLETLESCKGLVCDLNEVFELE